MRRVAVMALVVLAVAVAAVAGEGERQSYRFEVRAQGLGHVRFRGVFTVDGQARPLASARTPYRFSCEAGRTITGYFEVLDRGRSLELRVYDPAYSSRRAAASADGVDAVRFAWAAPGAGPRCIDFGSGACPPSVPGREVLDRLLEGRGRS